MQSILIDENEAIAAKNEVKKKKIIAFLFVAPLLIYIGIFFIMPIASMLSRSAYSTTVMDLIPQTTSALKQYDGQGIPEEDIVVIFAVELADLQSNRLSGRLAGQINRTLPGASSVIQSTARQLSRQLANDVEITQNVFFEINEQWQEPEIWRAIQRAGVPLKIDNFLTALDLQRSSTGEIVKRESAQIYAQLYKKTLMTAVMITLMTILLGYPLAYYLANISQDKASILMIFVLLPFWTSLLVRTTSWIAILQTNGVLNSVLLNIGIIKKPMEILYTQNATIIAMTHILLPFMVLPLYSVMRGIDPSYVKAAMSLGAKPFSAFTKVYLPMTMSGLGAGVLLVFIVSVGYYITPALVGGTDGQMISNIIAFHMQQSNNWELAAALGSILLIVILTLYWVYDRFVGVANIKLG
jgi:putative spermidine/putrescine transport system permease protein